MMEMMNDFVLLKELDKETVSPGGIITTSDKWGRKCEVMATSKESPVEEGDVVLKNVGKGTDIEMDGVKYEILHTDWIIAII